MAPAGARPSQESASPRGDKRDRSRGLELVPNRLERAPKALRSFRGTVPGRGRMRWPRLPFFLAWILVVPGVASLAASASCPGPLVDPSSGSCVLEGIAQHRAVAASPARERSSLAEPGWSETPWSGGLPTGRVLTSAAWDGARAFIFGGYAGQQRGYLDEIVRYDPEEERVALMAARLPTPRSTASAVFDGTHAYVFGGDDRGSGRTSEIVRYDPASDTIRVTGAKLPTGRSGTSAVWDGRYAYIFGGSQSDGSRVTDIVRYDPANDRIKVMGARLPVPTEGSSAAWDGTYAYIFGNWGDADTQILRYDPRTDAIAATGASLPGGRGWTAAVATTDGIHLFGGCGKACPETRNVIYDPASDEARTVASTPRGFWGASAVYDGSRVHVFGGTFAPSHAVPSNQVVHAALLAVVTVGALASVFFLLPLYTRLDRGGLLDNRVRRGLHAHVLAAPGTTCAEAARAVGTHFTTAARHLRILERFGLIVAHPARAGPRYFENHGRYAPEARAALALLRQPQNAIFLREASRIPRVGITEIARRLGIAKSTASRRASLLREAGLLGPGRTRGGQEPNSGKRPDGRP